MNLPPEYAERFKLSCPFCSKEVSIGTIEDGSTQIGYHANPVCSYWTYADNIVQYMLLVNLKMRSDAGQLEKN